MSDSAAQVIVIDDDEAVRDAVGLLLMSVGLEVASFPSAQDFLVGRSDNARACLVVDIRMPGMNGLELLERLRAEGTPPPVVFITGHGDVDLAVRAMKLGALDFIEKPFRDQDLIDRVQLALAVVDKRFEELADGHEISLLVEALTPREREVLERMVDGQSNKVMALELGLSERTVEVHRANVMTKTQTRNLAQLVRAVTQYRLLQAKG